MFYFIFTSDKEKPIWKQYDEYESDDTTVYKNEQLKVQITVWEDWYDDLPYRAEWTDIDGDNRYTYTCYSIGELYDAILLNAEDFSTNQLKWFEYMCTKVIK